MWLLYKNGGRHIAAQVDHIEQDGAETAFRLVNPGREAGIVSLPAGEWSLTTSPLAVSAWMAA